MTDGHFPISAMPDRFAAISDIHGNIDALTAVLADIDRQGIAVVVALGDLLSGPLQAKQTLDLLRARKIPCLRGNHDRWLVSQDPAEMGPSDRHAFDQLSEADLDWLRALPPQLRFGEEVLMVHGTPDSDLTYWAERVTDQGEVVQRDGAEITALAGTECAPLILCGHTHIPRVLRLGTGSLLVNPGSAGCPGYDDDHPVFHVVQTGLPDPAYAVLERQSVSGAGDVGAGEGAAWRAFIRHVPYDPTRMVALAQQANRPEWAAALATGWIR
ncbi:MAG: metallophosphoesterase family protein [Rhodospirillaceae bacterium]